MTVSYPLVVVVWHHVNFGGYKRQINGDAPDLILMDFNDTISSIGVHKGPNYDAWVQQHNSEPQVSFYQDSFYNGSHLTLKAGTYPNIHPIGFGDNISSIAFNRNLPLGTLINNQMVELVPLPVGYIVPIPLEIVLVRNINAQVPDRILLVEPIDDLHRVYGFDNVELVAVTAGPNYQGQTASFLTRNRVACVSNLAPGPNGTDPYTIAGERLLGACGQNMNIIEIN